jgi:hypothetical protein
VVDRWLPVRSQQALVIRLETIEQRLDALDQTLRSLRDSTDAAARATEELATLREALAALEKQAGRAGREQFKANTLAEAQATRLDSALDMLRAADTRREDRRTRAWMCCGLCCRRLMGSTRRCAPAGGCWRPPTTVRAFN